MATKFAVTIDSRHHGNSESLSHLFEGFLCNRHGDLRGATGAIKDILAALIFETEKLEKGSFNLY